MQIGVSVYKQTEITNRVDPDETASHEPSIQDLHCLHKYLFWSAGLKWLNPVLRTDNVTFIPDDDPAINN